MAIDFDSIPSPCFLLNEEALEANLQILNMVSHAADVKIICALKGFSFWYSFPMIRHYLDGATASSLNEATLINDEMNCEAHTYCPVYKEEEFDALLYRSSHLTFNSLSQYDFFSPKAKSIKKEVSLGLRINPEYSEIRTDLYNPAIKGSRLGIRREQLPDHLPEGIEGLHFHTLCENDSYTLERTLYAIEEKFSGLIKQAKWFNMGGGHLITREGYDVEHLVKTLQNFRSRYPNLEEVILEPGSAVGWQTGVLVSQVQDIIECENFHIAMLDTSFACHMPDCLEMPYKPTIVGAKDAKEGDKYVYRMGGNSCLAGDYIGMGDYCFKEPLEIGEKIIFDDMIHYTMVKTTFFNGVQHPRIAVWTKDNQLLILKEFSYQDYKSKLS